MNSALNRFQRIVRVSLQSSSVANSNSISLRTLASARPLPFNEQPRIRRQPSRPRRTRRNKRIPSRPPRELVLPETGLTASQLAALADVTDESVVSCAGTLDDSISNASSVLSPALVELITEELKLNLRFRPQAEKLLPTLTSSGVPRMPVVTVMGHVDHGKTSLLDSLRNSDVAAHEVGGITQSVAAFRVALSEPGEIDTRFATFIDTPGHAAFKAMRANGTVATDLVILVVAADDGVMPQTVEAGLLAREANVPVIVAINKCDTPGANPDRVRYQLLEQLELSTEQLGGEVQCVDISARTGQNLPALLEAVSLQAEMLDLRTEPSSAAAGICLECRMDRALGSVATVVIRVGTLRVGDYLVFQSNALHGELYGRVRKLIGSSGEAVTEAGPGVAVGVVGLKTTAPPGAEMCVVKNEKEAKAISQRIIARNAAAGSAIALGNMICAERIAKMKPNANDESRSDDVHSESEEEVEDVAEEDEFVHSVVVLVKGDVKGSADAVAHCVQGLGTKQFPIRILEAGVGEVTDLDVKVASAKNKAKGNKDEALIVAFNVRVKESAKKAAQRMGLDILNHSLIYNLEEELQERLEENARRQKGITEILGRASVVRVFEDGLIAGCSVENGTLSKEDTANVMRLPASATGSSVREVAFTGTVESIRHFAKDVRSVNKGSECGITIAGWSDFKPGDTVESFIVRKTGNGISKK